MASTPKTPRSGEQPGTTPAAEEATDVTVVPAVPERKTSIVGDLVRGALMGAVETVPGVSGGTVALVVGIYTQLIDSASHVVSAARRLISGPDRGRSALAELRQVRWRLIIPVFIGMLIAIVTVAGPMADLVDTYPELTRAAFFGMVLASVSIPLSMAGVRGIRWHQVLFGLVAGGITFWLVSLPPTETTPTPIVIVVAAAVAVCALLLPGLSGSFLLLTFGLYEPTMRAVSERDFGYLGLFALGMVIGVASLIKSLQWLLQHRRRITLVILTGVMLGAMRTLWPWQGEQRELHAPGDNWPVALLLFLAGFAVVITLAIIDARMLRRQAAAHLTG
ncbi:MAG: DUF368 domain-containing protein [Leucobacter sp.]